MQSTLCGIARSIRGIRHAPGSFVPVGAFFLLLVFMIADQNYSAAEINPEVYYGPELDVTGLPVGRETNILWREIVAPEGGPFWKFFSRSKRRIERFPSDEENEIISLFAGNDELGGFLGQLTKTDASISSPCVEALCIARYSDGDPWTPDLLEPYSAGFALRDDFMYALCKLRHLRHLELYCTSIGNARLSILKELPNLRYIGLPFDSQDAQLSDLSVLTGLEFINASGTRIQGNGFESLMRLRQLRTLDLRHLQLTDDAWKKLAGMSALRTLLLSRSNAGETALAQLSKSRSLRNVTLRFTRATDTGLLALAWIPSLRYLSTFGTEITTSGLRQFSSLRPDVELDESPPMEYSRFLNQRKYHAAYAGNIMAQHRLFELYSGDYGDLEDSDFVEALKWAIVSRDNRSKPWWGYRVSDEEMKKIEGKMRPNQIREARKRAEAYSFVKTHSTISLEPDRSSGLPIYQCVIHPFHPFGSSQKINRNPEIPPPRKIR